MPRARNCKHLPVTPAAKELCHPVPYSPALAQLCGHTLQAANTQAQSWRKGSTEMSFSGCQGSRFHLNLCKGLTLLLDFAGFASGHSFAQTKASTFCPRPHNPPTSALDLNCQPGRCSSVVPKSKPRTSTFDPGLPADLSGRHGSLQKPGAGNTVE